METMFWISYSSSLENPHFFLRYVVFAMVIEINSVTGGFSWEDIAWFAASTVWLPVFDYNQLSNYTVWLPLYGMISEK